MGIFKLVTGRNEKEGVKYLTSKPNCSTSNELFDFIKKLKKYVHLFFQPVRIKEFYKTKTKTETTIESVIEIENSDKCLKL